MFAAVARLFLRSVPWPAPYRALLLYMHTHMGHICSDPPSSGSNELICQMVINTVLAAHSLLWWHNGPAMLWQYYQLVLMMM